MAHVLEHLSSDQLRLIAADPLTDAGRALLERISGSDRPYRDLDEMFADSPDPYGEDLQADFDAEQQRDEERAPEPLALAEDPSGHFVEIGGHPVFIQEADYTESPGMKGQRDIYGRPLPYHRPVYEARFKTPDGLEYQFQALPDFNDKAGQWEIQFSRYIKSHPVEVPTGVGGAMETHQVDNQLFGIRDSGGNAFKVFRAVSQTLDKFIEEQKPREIRFSAHEPSRIRLYNHFIPKIEAKGYTFAGKPDGKFKNGRVYRFKRVSDRIGLSGGNPNHDEQGRFATSPSGAKLISSQRFRDEDTIKNKMGNGDYHVKISPDFEYHGDRFSVVMDGHHAMEAAKRNGIEPIYHVQSKNDNESVGHLERAEQSKTTAESNKHIDKFLASQKNDDEYHHVDNGQNVW